MDELLLEPWRPGVETYHRLGEQGVFEDVRVELLDGIVAQMSPKGRAHEQALAYLNRLAVQATPDAVEVRVQLALSLAPGWEPEPDLALVEAATARPYHPAGAGLVVEVAASSLRRDRELKAPVYGRHGIPECWIIDLVGSRLERLTAPGPSGYERREVLVDGLVTAERFPGLALDLPKLWRRAHA